MCRKRDGGRPGPQRRAPPARAAPPPGLHLPPYTRHLLSHNSQHILHCRTSISKGCSFTISRWGRSWWQERSRSFWPHVPTISCKGKTLPFVPTLNFPSLHGSSPVYMSNILMSGLFSTVWQERRVHPVSGTYWNRVKLISKQARPNSCSTIATLPSAFLPAIAAPLLVRDMHSVVRGSLQLSTQPNAVSSPWK